MNAQKLTNSTLQLGRNGFIHAEEVQPGSTVVVEKGILWLTCSDDLKDYMLTSGDRLTVNRRSDVLIEALDDARLSIIHTN